MALSTYDELLTALANLLNRDDLTPYLPDFVRLAEGEIDARDDLAKHRRRICRATATIDGEYAGLPTDYLGIQSIQLADPVVQLLRASPDNLVRLKASESVLQAQLASEYGVEPSAAPPIYYAIVGTELRFLPVPTREYELQLSVYERLPTLETNGTNWLLQLYPSIYLYGAAIHSAPFLQDDDRIGMWSGLFDQACAAAAKADPEPTEHVALSSGLVGLVGMGR